MRELNMAGDCPGREIAFRTFAETLDELRGVPDVSEHHFREVWRSRLSLSPEVTSNGWYDPPPYGIAVYTGSAFDSQPFRHASLRTSEFWPSERVIDWHNGYMYAYCSPVHIGTGLPGDFGLTLYFGRDDAIRSHFRKAIGVTRDILSAISPSSSSATLFHYSQQKIHEAGMRSNVASITDTVPVDLGHTLPSLADHFLSSFELPEEAREAARTSRLFISDSADWPVVKGGLFTVEPNLVSLDAPEMPQVSPHYVVRVTAEKVTVSSQGDEIYRMLGLA